MIYRAKMVLYHVMPLGSLYAAVSMNLAFSLLRQLYLQWLFDPVINETHIELNSRQQLESLLPTSISCPGPTQTFIHLEPGALYRR